jgi:hypothetical protein
LADERFDRGVEQRAVETSAFGMRQDDEYFQLWLLGKPLI